MTDATKNEIAWLVVQYFPEGELASSSTFCEWVSCQSFFKVFPHFQLWLKAHKWLLQQVPVHTYSVIWFIQKLFITTSAKLTETSASLLTIAIICSCGFVFVLNYHYLLHKEWYNQVSWKMSNKTSRNNERRATMQTAKGYSHLQRFEVQ